MEAIICNGIVALLAIGFTINTADAQIQWTAEQKAVWKTETAITDARIKGDQQAANSYYDDSYQGWPENSPIPIPKSNMDAASDYYTSLGGKYIFWNAVSTVIWVKVILLILITIFVRYTRIRMGKNQRTWPVAGCLVKKDGKWVLVGDYRVNYSCFLPIFLNGFKTFGGIRGPEMKRGINSHQPVSIIPV